MRTRSNVKMREALADLAGFTAIAVPETSSLLSSEIQVASWKPPALIIAEIAAGEAMRPGLLLRHKRGRHDECN